MKFYSLKNVCAFCDFLTCINFQILNIDFMMFEQIFKKMRFSDFLVGFNSSPNR